MKNSLSSISLVLLGAGGHAKSCINLIDSLKNFTIKGILGKKEEVGKDLLGYPIIGTDDDLTNIATSSKAIITLGQIKSTSNRKKLFKMISNLNIVSPSLISPFSSFSEHSLIGMGSVVMHGSLVNASTSVGNNCILNSQCIIEHDVFIGDHCHISTGAKLNGGVIIEDECFVGSGTTIREGVTIGKGSIIGMGESIFHDCEPGSIIKTTNRSI